MRPTNLVVFTVAVVLTGAAFSGCESQCALNQPACQPRGITLSTSKIDKSDGSAAGNTLSVKITGDLMPVPLFAQLRLPVAAGETPPAIAPMDVTPITGTPDTYAISATANRANLSPGCEYFLDVYQGSPEYQVVDNICKYSVSVVSGDLKWNTTPTAVQLIDTLPQTDLLTAMKGRGVWIYDESTIVVQKFYSIGQNDYAKFMAISIDHMGNFSTNELSVPGLTPKSFGSFKNSIGTIIDYAFDAAKKNPFIYPANIMQPGGGAKTFMLSQSQGSLSITDQFNDFSVDSTGAFLVTALSTGELQFWDKSLTSRMLVNPPTMNASKVVIMDLDRDGLGDVISFDAQGTPQFFVQHPDKSFNYDSNRSRLRTDLGTGSISAIAVGDLDGDGVDDLAIVRLASPATITFYLNRGDGTFKQAASSVPHKQTVAAVAIGPVGIANGMGSHYPKNLVVLDNVTMQGQTTLDTGVSVYSNQTHDACPFKITPCQ